MLAFFSLTDMALSHRLDALSSEPAFLHPSYLVNRPPSQKLEGIQIDGAPRFMPLLRLPVGEYRWSNGFKNQHQLGMRVPLRIFLVGYVQFH